MPQRPTIQPGNPFTVYGGDFRQRMVGAWSISSPGPGGRVHNCAPNISSLTQTGAVGHGLISQPYHSNGWGSWYGVSLTTSDNVVEATGTWVDLGDPIGTNDDVTVLVGWVPLATTVPTGSGSGNIFGRGNDGSGNGWSLLCGVNSTNLMQFADVSAGGQHTSTVTGIIPLVPNFFAGTYKQGVRTQCCLNGRLGNAAATASGLRTSGKGCYLGKQPGAASTSHVDNVLFCFLWRRAMSEVELQFLTLQPWILWSDAARADKFIPVDKINVFDNIWIAGQTVSGQTQDAIAIQIDGLGLEKSVFDTASVTEFVQLRSVLQINVFDTATPTEILTAQQFMKINVFDSVPISESLNLEYAFIHQWNDIVAFTEPLMHIWNVVSDITEMFITHSWNVRSVLDSITHSWRVLPQQLQTLFDGSIQWITSVVDWSTRKVGVSDDIPVSESVTIRGPSFGIKVSDAINVVESLTVRMHRFIQLFEQTTPAEFVKLVLPLKINVFDNVNPTDAIIVPPLVIPVSVFDTVTVTESVTVIHS